MHRCRASEPLSDADHRGRLSAGATARDRVEEVARSKDISLSNPQNLAETLWTRGAGHVIGARALAVTARQWAIENGDQDLPKAIFNGRYSASIHLLAGFSLELLLKSAFLFHGGDPDKLRNIGHDLVSAYDHALEAGFVTSTANLRWIVERLREMHLHHRFRYGGQETVEMPELELTLTALEQLARELGSYVQHSPS